MKTIRIILNSSIVSSFRIPNVLVKALKDNSSFYFLGERSLGKGYFADPNGGNLNGVYPLNQFYIEFKDLRDEDIMEEITQTESSSKMKDASKGYKKACEVASFLASDQELSKKHKPSWNPQIKRTKLFSLAEANCG